MARCPGRSMPSFESLFDRSPDVTAEAAGRVNLIGEHTDYNEGFVLPVPVPQKTRVELARRSDDRIRVWSDGFSAGATLAEYGVGGEAAGKGWLDYVQAVTWVLRGAGRAVGGFDVRIASEVPPGSGLASSAALEIALLRAVRAALDLRLDDETLAKLGQRAEREFVGAPVGIMDQMVASVGRPGAALFLDTRSLSCDLIDVPPTVDLVVIDSGVAHGHAKGEYRTRRAECERAAALLGVRALRDVAADAGGRSRLSALPPPLDRRARHVVTENGRVLEAVTALKRGDLPRLGALLMESHASLRDDFEVSTADVDTLVATACHHGDVFGARLTGGGFGGAVVALATAGRGRAAAAGIAERYAALSGLKPVVVLPRP